MNTKIKETLLYIFFASSYYAFGGIAVIVTGYTVREDWVLYGIVCGPQLWMTFFDHHFFLLFSRKTTKQ